MVKVIYYKGQEIAEEDINTMKRCDICGKEAKRMWSYGNKHSCSAEHLQVIKDELKKKRTLNLVCKICGKNCHTKAMLSIHILSKHKTEIGYLNELWEVK